ncbi:hypothetical protein vBYenM531-1_86 [Yersinia phage vB_YenM_531]|nr:hypothetical protein vBYenM531-1_86 [Yersinia phage vB_YenM_531]QKN87521.1 hypothetical protein vBYenM281_086 [Yersinia phage vB_YenM_281]
MNGNRKIVYDIVKLNPDLRAPELYRMVIDEANMWRQSMDQCLRDLVNTGKLQRNGKRGSYTYRVLTHDRESESIRRRKN